MKAFLKSAFITFSFLWIGLFCLEVVAYAGNIEVFVSILPQKTFVKKIGGTLVNVSVMVLPGASPATYEPRPRQMARLSRAKAYFSIGVPFERVWLEKIASTNQTMRLIKTDEGIEKMPMEVQGLGPAGFSQQAEKMKREPHDHEEIMDPHIWTSPPLVRIQTENILKGLITIDPKNRSVYEERARSFIAEINALDAELRELFKGKAGMAFMVFHPSWGYFARTYGLVQIPIEIEGKEPKPGQIRQLISYAKEKGIKVVFVQPEFSKKSADIISRAIGGEVAFVSPLAENWTENLKRAAEKFEVALRGIRNGGG